MPALLCVSLRRQVGARIVKALKNVRAGGRNDSLMTLTGNFSEEKKKKKGGRGVWELSSAAMPGQLEECQRD